MKRTVVLVLIASFVLALSNNAYADPDLVVTDIRISASGAQHNVFVTTADLGDGAGLVYNIRVLFPSGATSTIIVSGTGEFGIGSSVLATSANPGVMVESSV